MNTIRRAFYALFLLLGLHNQLYSMELAKVSQQNRTKQNTFKDITTRSQACEFLGLQEDDETLPNFATEETIKMQFKKLALKFHPDWAAKNKLTKEEAEEKFKLLKKAIDILLGKDKSEMLGSAFMNEMRAKFNGKNGCEKEPIEPLTFLGLFPYANVYKIQSYEEGEGFRMASVKYETEYLPIYYWARRVFFAGTAVAAGFGLWYLLKSKYGSK